MSAPHNPPARGQIWQERDNRFTRFVRVIAVDKSWVNVETVLPAQEGWKVAPRSQKRWASIERFDGRYGGYVQHPARPTVGGGDE